MERGDFSYKDYSVANEQAFLHCILDSSVPTNQHSWNYFWATSQKDIHDILNITDTIPESSDELSKQFSSNMSIFISPLQQQNHTRKLKYNNMTIMCIYDQVAKLSQLTKL